MVERGGEEGGSEGEVDRCEEEGRHFRLTS
jgi:hypothetical protein